MDNVVILTKTHVFRFPRRTEHRFPVEEKFWLDYVRPHTSIQLPELQMASLDGEEFSFYPKLAGQTYAELGDSERERATPQVARRLAEFCAALHALPVPLAAPHDLNFYLSPQEMAETRAGLSSDPGLSQTFEQAASRVQAYDQSEAPLSVVHDDLHPGNLLVQNGQLSAILDFGDCRVTHPIRDLFQPFYHDFKRYFLHERYFGLSAMLVRNYTQLTHRTVNLTYLADLATLRTLCDGLCDQLDISKRLSQLAEYTRQYEDLL